MGNGKGGKGNCDMRLAGDKVGNDKGSKSNGNGDKGGG